MKSCGILTRTLLFAILLTALTTVEAIAEVAPVGPELAVNTTTDGNQALGFSLNHNDRVAADASGKFGVVWQGSTSTDPQNIEVYVRLFNADGSARTGEIVVNTTTAGPQENPMIAMADNGQFVVTWREIGEKRVKARLFDADGDPLSGEFNVSQKGNAHTAYYNTSVAMDADGDFVVLYAKSTMTAVSFLFQRYNAAGAAQGKAIVAATSGLGNASATLDVAANGSFVLVTHDFFQRYSASGAKIGPQMTYEDAGSNGFNADVAVAADGSFVIAWPSSSGTGGYFAQTYNVNGARAVPNNFQITTGGGGDTASPSVAIDDANGEIVFIRQGSTAPQGPVGVHATRFDLTGNILAAEFQVNTTPLGGFLNHGFASVTETVNGGFVGVWERKTDGENRDIFGQGYGFVEP
jgi:hypothetical protein